MSKHWLRHSVVAAVCGLVPLLPVAPVQAAAPAAKPGAAVESPALTRFRDSAPPVMEQIAQAEAAAQPAYAPSSPVQWQPLRTVSNPRLYREVFGFAFASSLGDPTIGYTSWNMSLLSTVAYFGVHVDWTGDLSSDSGLSIWNDPNGPVPGFMTAAHVAGTKVVLTIEMFDSTNGTPNMCSALQRSSLTIQRAVAQVNAKGIDGINVDYESNNTMCTDPSTGASQSSQSLFTSFVKNLRAAMPSGSYLSVDTYSGAAGYRDSSGAYLGFFDIGSLANYVDSFFVMAYDMEYANWSSPPLSCPSFCLGPTAPLSTYDFNDTRAANEYTAVVPASKVILGIPYYGRKECVSIPDPTQIPANAMGTSVAADGYLDAAGEQGYPGNTQYTIHRETRDPLSQTRWDTFSSTSAGCNREMYWDDSVALGDKYNLVINDHLRGAGIFALNYGGGAPELWNLIDLKFGQCSQAAISADHSTPQIPNTTVTFSATALCAGTATYRFWVQAPGGNFTVAQAYGTSSTFAWNTTGLPLGTYNFEVDARNQGATVAYDSYARMSFRLANCVTPTLTADKPSPQVRGSTVTFTPSVACSGTPEYQFLVLPPGATSWTTVQNYGVSNTFAWDTTNLAYGDYYVGVWVRNAGTTVANESYSSIPFSLTSCMTPSLTADKASPEPTGTQVLLTGGATCDGTAQYRFMIQPPGGSWSVVQDFGTTSTFSWLGGGPGGTYNLELDAKSAAAPLSTIATASIQYVLQSCTAVTLATNPTPPQQPGPTVVLTGTATCPGTTEYRFSITRPDGTGGVVLGYSSANTYSWNTTGLAVGYYNLKVEARNVGATSPNEVVATASYFLAHPPCAGPTVTANPASPQQTGTQVTFTATSTGCPQPLYEFWMMASGSTTWQLVQPFSTNPKFAWNSTGALDGTEQFEVWVRDAFSLGSSCPAGRGCYDALVDTSYTVIAPHCASTTVAAAPTSVLQGNGTHVTVTAAATGCTNYALYEFWIRVAPAINWTLVRSYSTSATYDWNTTGAGAGTVYLGVHVRDVNSAAAYDAVASTPVTVNAPCTSVTLSASPTSVLQGTGTHVTVTATASGCPDPPVYEFWLRPASSPTWQLVQPYGASATYDWNSTGAAVGTVYLGVWARDSSSIASYNAVASTPVSVTTPSCASVTISASPASVTHSSSNGTHVTVTAVAAGCSTSPVYEFWIRPASSATWQMVQAYGTSASYDWNTTGAGVGTVYVGVWVRDVRSPNGYDAVASTPVTVN